MMKNWKISWNMAALFAVVLLVSGCSGADKAGNGVVAIPSSFDFDTTVMRLQKALRNNPKITLIAPFDPFDHSANAKTVALDLAPTRLFVFGNPRLGTGLMASAATAALDLPQKMLVYERAGQVVVAYNAPQYLASRHGINDQQESLTKIAGALEKLARHAAQGEGSSE